MLNVAQCLRISRGNDSLSFLAVYLSRPVAGRLIQTVFQAVITLIEDCPRQRLSDSL